MCECVSKSVCVRVCVCVCVCHMCVHLLRRCPVCNLPFSDAAFVRYPNGVITHLKCGRNKTICPVTGTWFGTV